MVTIQLISAFCFQLIDSTVPLLPKSEILKPIAIFCGCTFQFVSDLVTAGQKPQTSLLKMQLVYLIQVLTLLEATFFQNQWQVQDSSFITLSLGTIELEPLLSELLYEGIILL